MRNSKPTILIYNPISGHGHLDSWNALFVGLLLERGYRVLALTPDKMALQVRLTRRKLMGHPMLHVLDWNAPRFQPRNKVNQIRWLWEWWLGYGDHYTYKRPGSRVSPGMPLIIRIKKRVSQFVVPPLFLASRALYFLYRQAGSAAQCISGTIRRISRLGEEPSELHYLDPVDMAQRVNSALNKSPWQPDFIFNMYLDMYKTSQEPWRKFAAICPLRWGGIRFVPADPPPREGYYALPSLRGVCFLDETTCKTYGASILDKYFQYLPDVTNAELPDGLCPLADETLRRAAGRKIVFLGGSIGGQKNIARWCELIALADPKRWFFVQVGEIHANTFSSEDTRAFKRLVAAPPENLLLHAQYLSDERDFNAVIEVADILFAVYRNFRISSNMSGKAAHFEKPILVSDGFLMGERVCHYGIGLAVSQDDTQAMLAAIERLAVEPIPVENFARYRTVFQEQTIGDNLCNFLDHVSVS